LAASAGIARPIPTDAPVGEISAEAQHLLDTCQASLAAGIEQVIIVTSSQKRAIEDHFDLSFELERLLEEKGEIEKLRIVRKISDLAQIAYVRQKEQLGLGHAILMTKDLIGHEPFAVLLPDDVVIADRPCIGQLMHAYEQTHASTIAVMQVPPQDVSRYGVVGTDEPDSALDGGRLAMMLISRGLLKRPLNKKLEERLVGGSMALLLLLFALITIVDVKRFL